MKNVMNTQDVAEYLGLGRTSTYRLFQLKGFPGIKIGKNYVIYREDLDAYLQDHRGGQIYLHD